MRHEHIETLATTAFLSTQMWCVQNLFVQSISLSTLYKRRHMYLHSFFLCWHISIGNLVTNCTASRSLVPLRQILQAMATGQVLVRKRDQKVPNIFIVQAAPLLHYIETNKSLKISVHVCVCFFLQYVSVRKFKKCGLQGRFAVGHCTASHCISLQIEITLK